MNYTAPAKTVTGPASVRYSETALSGIYEISKIVTSPANLRVMLNNVVSVMSSFLDMRLATVTLLNKDGDPEIKVAASTEHSIDASEEADLPMPVIDQIVATAMPLVVQNCAIHPLFKDWKRLGNVDANAVQTFIGVPIRVDQRLSGRSPSSACGKAAWIPGRPRCTLPDHGGEPRRPGSQASSRRRRGSRKTDIRAASPRQRAFHAQTTPSKSCLRQGDGHPRQKPRIQA